MIYGILVIHGATQGALSHKLVCTISETFSEIVVTVVTTIVYMVT